MRSSGTCCLFSIEGKMRTRILLLFLSLLPTSDDISIRIGSRPLFVTFC
jgi:hypothetical protein